ncbi:hypothetical protein BH11BAC1_BH11BAC1_02820 [soil metagenome]
MPFNKSDDITRLILNSALDAIVCMAADGKISFWSKQAENIFGWKEEEVIGKLLSDTIIPARHRSSHGEGMRRYVQTGKATVLNRHFEIEAIDKNENELFVELTIVPVKQEGEEFFCGFLRDITERRNAKAELLKEKELSEFVFENLPGIFYLQDEQGKYLRWNKNFEIASEYSAEEIEQLDALDFFHGDDRSRIDEAIKTVFREGKVEVIADAVTKSKRVLPFYFKAKSIIYEGKKCLIGSGIDLSKQQRAQQDVKISEEKYRALFEQASDPIMVTDFTGRFLDVNESLCKMFGYSKGELMGMNIADLIERNQLAKSPINFAGLAAGDHIFSKRKMLHKDGHTIEVEANVKKISATSVLAIARDITERIKFENKLAESENRFRTIFETEPECIPLLDAECFVIDMNPAGLSILEAGNAEQVIGQDVLQFIDKEYQQAFIDLNKEVFAGKSRTLEFSLISLKGTHRWMEMHAVPLRNSAGEVISNLSVARDVTDKKDAAEMIRRSEERYRALVENATEALVVFDAVSGKFESVSQSAVDFFKMSKEELMKIGPLDISPKHQPDGTLSADKAQAKITEAINGGKPSFEWSHCDKFGNIIPCEIFLVSLPSDNQKLIRGSIFNISDRKKSEEAIRLSAQKYKLLFNKNPLPMLMLSKPELHIIDVNDAAIIQYGYSREEFLNMTAFDIRPKDDWQPFTKTIERSTEGINDFGIWRHRKKDGTIIKVEVRAHQIVNDGIPAWLILTNDITERLIAEEKLKASEYQFRKVTENEILGVAWATPDGKVTNANSTFLKMLGYSMEEMHGMHFSEITHPDDVQKELVLIEEVFNSKRDFYQIEKRYKTSKGEFIWVDLSLSIYRNSANNEIEFFIGIVQNIHERKMAEEEIKRSHEELRQLSSYLETIREEERTNIAREIHDELGQQLTGLKMDISWLNKKIPGDNISVHEKIAGMISLIDETVKTVRRISTELRPGILDDLGLLDALQWQSHEFEKRTGIATKFDTTFSESSFEKNLSTGIFRVFQETLTNVARHAHASKIVTSFDRRDENFVLRVSDNGKGFDEKEIKSKRTLGLVGMKERAKMFGGNLSVQSESGKGTVITLSVPMRISESTITEVIK